MLPKRSVYVKGNDGQYKWTNINFLIEDDDLLEKYNSICDKVSADITKEFHSEPFYNNFFWNTKINCYEDQVRLLL